VGEWQGINGRFSWYRNLALVIATVKVRPQLKQKITLLPQLEALMTITSGAPS
jgi:hypothetical protein